MAKHAALSAVVNTPGQAGKLAWCWHSPARRRVRRGRLGVAGLAAPGRPRVARGPRLGAWVSDSGDASVTGGVYGELGCVGVGARGGWGDVGVGARGSRRTWESGRVGVRAQGWLVRCRSHREGRLLAGADSSRGRGVPGEAGSRGAVETLRCGVPGETGPAELRVPGGLTGVRSTHRRRRLFPGACGSASGHRRRLGGPAWLSTIARPVGHLPAETAPYRDGLAAAAGGRASLRTCRVAWRTGCLQDGPGHVAGPSWLRWPAPAGPISGHGWSSCRLGD